MPIMDQQSSILSEQELHLLASHSPAEKNSSLRVYSYKYKVTLDDCIISYSKDIDQLVLMLKTSPRGVAVILPKQIESAPPAELEKLISLLTLRTDIRAFWLGKLPSMETNLPIFVHCANEKLLLENIMSWKNYINLRFSNWIAQYSVAFITEDKEKIKTHQANFFAMGLSNVSYFNAQTSLTELGRQRLIIIDLEVVGLHLVNILKDLTNKEWFPIIIIYGRLSANVCHATYTLIETNGFPVLASLSEIPDKIQWQRLFSSLFSKVYLKHWVNEECSEASAYKLYDLETSSVISYFCSYGMSKQQISELPMIENTHLIINAKSLSDWYPEGTKREVRESLAEDLNCNPFNLHVCIEQPENILATSIFFSALVMARLAQTKVYWWVESEKNLLTDCLKSMPISDIILSESLSLTLLAEAPEKLLEFIEQAQLQQINIIVTLPPSATTREALALFGIESVISK